METDRLVRKMGRSAGIGLLAAGLLAGSGQMLSAQDVDYVSCGFFSTQAEAQDYLEIRGTLRDNAIMDPDGNGIACEGAFPESPMPVTLPNTGTAQNAASSTTNRSLIVVAFGIVGASIVLRARTLPQKRYARSAWR